MVKQMTVAVAVAVADDFFLREMVRHTLRTVRPLLESASESASESEFRIRIQSGPEPNLTARRERGKGSKRKELHI